MLTKSMRSFCDDVRGATAIMFGLCLFLLMDVVGVAFDSARLYSINDKVRNALDASVLAAAKLLDVDGATDSDVVARAQAFFNTYVPQLNGTSITLTNFLVTTNRRDYSVTASVDVNYDTAFGKLFSMPNVRFSPSSTVVFKTKKVELAMVLDITGSMCDPNPAPCTSAPKLDGLKAAAKDMIDVLAANNPDPSAVRAALAPYSASVNIGSYFTAATNLPASAEPCVVERSGSAGTNDDPPSSGRWFDPPPVGYCPTGAPAMAMQDVSVTTTRNDLKTAIDSMQAQMSTAGHIGLSWGWYMVSDRWSSFWPAASRPKPAGPDVLKAVLLMTDGIFNQSYSSHGGNFQESACVPNSSCDTSELNV